MLRALPLALMPLLVLPFAPGSATSGPAERWGWPVAPPHTILRPWVAPATRYSAGHRGIDIAAPDGIVVAPLAGTVSFVGVVVDRPVLSIRHADGLVTSYEPVESTLATGETVTSGKPLGIVQSGHCETRCLHFGVRRGGDYVSPLRYLAGMDRAVLVPTRRVLTPPAGESARIRFVLEPRASAYRPISDREALGGVEPKLNITRVTHRFLEVLDRRNCLLPRYRFACPTRSPP